MNHASPLSRITTDIKSRPSMIFIMGPPGIGKTTLAGWIENIVCQPFGREDSWSLLKQSGAIPKDLPILPRANTWLDLMTNLEALRTEDHPYKAIAIDTATCAESLCHEEVTNVVYNGSWEQFMAYHRGFDIAANEYWDGYFLDKLDALREEKGMSIILLGHTKVAPFKNPTGEDFDRYTPCLHKKNAAFLIQRSDAVLFATWYTEVEDGKGKGGKSRVLHTEHMPGYDAKNRLNLPETIDMGNSGQEAWNNLKNAIREARTNA